MEVGADDPFRHALRSALAEAMQVSEGSAWAPKHLIERSAQLVAARPAAPPPVASEIVNQRRTAENWWRLRNTPDKAIGASAVVLTLAETYGDWACSEAAATEELWHAWLDSTARTKSSGVVKPVGILVALCHAASGQPPPAAAAIKQSDKELQALPTIVGHLRADGVLPAGVAMAFEQLRRVLIGWVEAGEPIPLAGARAELLAALYSLAPTSAPAGAATPDETTTGAMRADVGTEDHRSPSAVASVRSADEVDGGPNAADVVGPAAGEDDGGGSSEPRPHGRDARRSRRQRRAVAGVFGVAAVLGALTAVTEIGGSSSVGEVAVETSITEGASDPGSSIPLAADDAGSGTTEDSDTDASGSEPVIELELPASDEVSPSEGEPDVGASRGGGVVGDAAPEPVNETSDADDRPGSDPSDGGASSMEPVPEAARPTAAEVVESLENIGAVEQLAEVFAGGLEGFEDSISSALASNARIVAETDGPEAAYKLIANAIGRGDVAGAQIEALALQYLYQAEPERAGPIIQDLAAKDQEGFASLALAEILVPEQNWSAVEAAALDAIELLPDTADDAMGWAAMYRGLAALQLGRSGDAVEGFEQAADLVSLPTWAASNLVTAYRAVGGRESLEAALELLDGLELRPGLEMESARRRAEVLLALDDPDAALEAAQRAVDAETAETSGPVRATNHLILANVFEALDDQRAGDEFRAAYEFDPANPTTAVELSYWLLFTTGWSDEVQMLAQSATLNPRAGVGEWSHLCRVLFSKLDFEAARAPCDTALTFDDASADAYYMRGRVGVRLNEDREMRLGFFERAVDLDPDYDDAWTNVCYEHAFYGDDDELALERCEEGVQAEGLPADYAVSHGLALERNGRIGEAEAMFREYAESEEGAEDVNVWWRLARLHESIPGADWAEVASFFERADELAPDDPMILQRFGLALLRSDDERAEDVLSRVIAFDDPATELVYGHAIAVHRRDAAEGDVLMARLLAVDPAEAWWTLGSLPAPDGWRDRALDAALAVTGNDETLNLMYLYREMADLDDCRDLEALVEEVIERDPERRRPYMAQLGWCLTAAANPSAEEFAWLTEIAEREIGSGDAALGHYLRGYHVHDEMAGDERRSDADRRDSIRAAVLDLEAAISLDATYYAPYSALAWMARSREGLRSVPNLLAAWQKIADQWPNWADWKRLRAMDAALMEIAPEELDRLFDEALEVTPDDLSLLGALALEKWYAPDSDREAAEALVRRIISLGSTDSRIFRTIAAEVPAEDERTEARLFAQAAATAGDADSVTILGDRWRDLGEFEKAEEAYRQAMEIEAPDEYVYPEIRLIDLLAVGPAGRSKREIPALLAEVDRRAPEELTIDQVVFWAWEIDLTTSMVDGAPLVAEIMSFVPDSAVRDPRIADVAARVMTLWPDESGYRAALDILAVVPT